MAEAQRRSLTPEEFFQWQANQERNYELVDGTPVLPLKAMTGATLRHDTLTVNATIALGAQLRGGPCRARSTDIAVRISKNRIRRPDLTIDCGAPIDAAMEASEPRLVLEVLSPSTMDLDRFQKLDEYRSHGTIRLILLAETRLPRVGVWRLADAGWAAEEYVGLQAVIRMPEIGAELSLADLYEGLAFE